MQLHCKKIRIIFKKIQLQCRKIRLHFSKIQLQCSKIHNHCNDAHICKILLCFCVIFAIFVKNQSEKGEILC